MGGGWAIKLLVTLGSSTTTRLNLNKTKAYPNLSHSFHQITPKLKPLKPNGSVMPPSSVFYLVSDCMRVCWALGPVTHIFPLLAHNSLCV